MVMTQDDSTEESLRAFQDEIAYQDLPIVQSQRPELLPLDLQAELHLRSDKTAIAYRRWLNELGLDLRNQLSSSIAAGTTYRAALCVCSGKTQVRLH